MRMGEFGKEFRLPYSRVGAIKGLLRSLSTERNDRNDSKEPLPHGKAATFFLCQTHRKQYWYSMYATQWYTTFYYQSYYLCHCISCVTINSSRLLSYNWLAKEPVI